MLTVNLLGNVNKPKPQTITTLINAAQQDIPLVRREAILTLGRLVESQALPIIQTMLNSEHRELKLTALEALCHYPPAEQGTIPVAHLLKDADLDIRLNTMQIMLANGSTLAREHVCDALDDEHLEICRAMLKALTPNEYHPDLSKPLFQLLFRFGGELRMETAATLRQVNDFSLAPKLFEMLTNAELEEYHWICIDALSEMYIDQPNLYHGPGESYAA